MSTETIETVVKMLESLPDTAQNAAAEHLRGYIAELQDEIRWEGLVKSTESKSPQGGLAAPYKAAKPRIRAP